ncbi:MAG: glycosyltransferase [Victivallaceae bacterium]|nr:glycosyltransferase [Victivallaceae bacterium]
MGHDCKLFDPSLGNLFELLCGKNFSDDIGKIDVCHVNGLWSLSGHSVCRLAGASGIPYVVSLRGMLYPQAYRNRSHWKKALAGRLYQFDDLRSATCVHATCEEEMAHFRNFGFVNPVAVIPNPIPVSDGKRRFPAKFTLGYLGRIHPMKGIDKLLYASAESGLDVPLLIAGEGDPTYVRFLRRMVERLHLKNVRFIGYVEETAKERFFDDVSVVALCSDFESFGNSVAESLAHGVPVLVSSGSPWEAVAERGCGWRGGGTVEDIANVLAVASGLDRERLESMGEIGRELVRGYCSVELVSARLEKMYLWMTGAASRPDFVFVK